MEEGEKQSETPPQPTVAQPASSVSEPPKKQKPKWIVPAIVVGIFIFGAGAWAGYNYWLKPAVPEEQPVEEEQLEEKDEFADWETYRNEELGIEFRHPNYLVVEKTSSDPPFKETEFTKNIFIMNSSDYRGRESGFRIIIRGPASLLSDENWREYYSTSDLFNEVNINGRAFFEHDASSEDYVIVNNTLIDENIMKIVTFSLEAHLNKEQLARQIYNQILSTFKFLD